MILIARNFIGPFYYIQMGHNDHTIAQQLLNENVGSGAILSPHHLELEKLSALAKEFLDLGKEVYYDPQHYNLEFEHKEGYPCIGIKTVSDFERNKFDVSELYKNLQFQKDLNVTSIIIPTPFTSIMSQEWIDFICFMAKHSLYWKTSNGIKKDILLTLAISSEVIENDEIKQSLLDYVTGLDVDGFYIVCQAPDQSAFPINENYIISLMDLVFRLKQNRYKVIMGYSSYCSVLLFPFGIDGFCSGGFSNRRAFDIDEWNNRLEEDKRGRGGPRPRFYSPLLLSTFIYPDESDLLFQSGLWRDLGENQYSDLLFDGQIPSSKVAVWKLKASFQHYFASCDSLCRQYRPLNLQQRIDVLLQSIGQAIKRQEQINTSVRLGIESQGRHLKVWLDSLKKYLSRVQEDLKYEYR